MKPRWASCLERGCCLEGLVQISWTSRQGSEIRIRTSPLHEVVNFSRDFGSIGVISVLARHRAGISYQREIQDDFQAASSFLHSLLSLVIPVLSTTGASERDISD